MPALHCRAYDVHSANLAFAGTLRTDDRLRTTRLRDSYTNKHVFFFSHLVSEGYMYAYY